MTYYLLENVLKDGIHTVRGMQCTNLQCVAQWYFYINRQPCNHNAGLDIEPCQRLRSFLHGPSQSVTHPLLK